MNQFELYMRVLKAFETEELDYVLVGGFAVILYGMQRSTRDIDIFMDIQGVKIHVAAPEALHRLKKDT